MSSYNWILAIHVIGFVVWVGGLVGLATLLSAHRRLADSTVEELVAIERKVAMEMDIGALIAIVSGVSMIIMSRKMGSAWPMKQPWMHVKLTLAVGLLAVHGVVRAKVGKAKRGDRSGASPALAIIAGLLVVGVIIMVVARPIG